jgi:hypothetical protein
MQLPQLGRKPRLAGLQGKQLVQALDGLFYRIRNGELQSESESRVKRLDHGRDSNL